MSTPQDHTATPRLVSDEGAGSAPTPIPTAIPADVLVRLRAQYPDVDLYVVNDKHKIVVRVPANAEWRRFMKAATDDTRRSEAVAQLARNSVAWLAAAGAETAWPQVVAHYDALLEKRPGIAEAVGGVCADLARDTENDAAKKL